MDDFNGGAGKCPLCRQEEGRDTYIVHLRGTKMSGLNSPKCATSIRPYKDLVWAHDNFLGTKRDAVSRGRLSRMAGARREEILDH